MPLSKEEEAHIAGRHEAVVAKAGKKRRFIGWECRVPA